MIQIVEENRRPSFGQRVLEGITQGTTTAIQQHTAREKERAEKAAITKLFGTEAANLPADLRKEFVSKQLTGDVELAKQQRKFELQNQLLSDLGVKEYFEETPEKTDMALDELEISSEEQKPKTIKKIPKKELEKKLIPQDKILKASLVNPAIADKMQKHNDNILKDIRHEQGISEKRSNILRQERSPIIKEIIDTANRSKSSIKNKEHLMHLIDKGDLDDPTFAALASMIPLNLGKRLLSPDTVEYKGGLVDEFGDLKNIFKGATRVKEVEIYEDKLADIYLTDEQKKAILKSRINMAKIDLIREQAAAEVEKEYPDLTALEFNQKIDEYMKPKMDAFFNSVWDQQKAVIDQAESRKKIPLDINDPDDKSIMQQILKEAGGDKTKAKSIAKKKGYSW